MSDKKKDLSAQSRREDEVLNRALLWIGNAAGTGACNIRYESTYAVERFVGWNVARIR